MSENIISKKDHMNYTFAAGLSEPEGCVPPDQLTLSQTEGGGGDYAHYCVLPSDFQTFLRPCRESWVLMTICCSST